MSIYSCAASFCSNTRYNVKKRNADIVFHSFPTDEVVRCHWIQFCRRGETWDAGSRNVICSVHFRPEDYQMARAPPNGNKRILRKLNIGAVPSLYNEHQSCVLQKSTQSSDKDSHIEPIVLENDEENDRILPKQRFEFCRVCLNHYEDDSLVPIESQIQNMTVLDMIIELTSFETEHNDAYPTVICLQCMDQLQQAYNIRQHFIAQAELLMQLVADNKLFSYLDDRIRCYSGYVSEPLGQEGSVKSESFLCTLDPEVSNETAALAEMEEPDNLISLDHSAYTKIFSVDKLDEAEDYAEYAEEKVSDSLDDEMSSGSTRLNAKNKNRMPASRKGCLSSSEEYHPTKTRKVKPGRKQGNKVAGGHLPYENEPKLSFPLTTCYICDKQHDNIVDRDLHMREHIPMLPYQCVECCHASGENDEKKADGERNRALQPPVLKTMNLLNRHFLMHRKPLKCDKCYRRFCTPLQLTTHLWDYHGPSSKGLTCEYCGKQFFRRILFRSHVSYHRMEQCGKYKCRTCGRSFGSKDSLRRHEVSHTGEKKFKCQFCDKRFTTSYNRLAHQRIHTGELTHKCPDCGKGFLDDSRLRMHLEKHQNSGCSNKQRVELKPALSFGKTFHCPYSGCDYTANTYSAMYVHRRSKHNSSYSCEVCSKSFPFSNKLKVHMMLHTGEKPYQCDICERRFRLSLHYRKHLQTHNPDSNYNCTICSKSFKLPVYLQAHMLTHSSERKFSCDFCSNSYKTKGELTKHRRLKHAKQIAEDATECSQSIDGSF